MVTKSTDFVPSNFVPAGRGYPILDSRGSMVELLKGSREEAEKYAKILNMVSKDTETYTVGMSVPLTRAVCMGDV